MTKIARLLATDSPDEIAAELLNTGGVVIENLLDAATLDAVRADVRPLLDEADPGIAHLNPGVAAFFGDRTKHVSGMAGKSKVFATEAMCSPLLLEVCDRVLLPSCASYVLNLGHLMDRGPGAAQQWIHRDEDVWAHFPRPRPNLQVATVIALEDFTEDNGATCLVPGSHKWPIERRPEPEEVVKATMKAGSAVLYLGSTMHAGGANTTDDCWRPGIHLSYVVGWLRTEENNVLAVPPKVAKELPRRAQELLGYGVHDAIAIAGGYLGMVGMRDPGELLAEGAI
jgi:ectoine hydroxylase-related dioxygenase (phytanoyl-CoA dioxygenase family)